MTPFYDRLAELERRRASFAVATVVGRRSPVSSHLGDRALVFADGHMEGFVGGSCSRDIVRRQALEAIRSGRPLLLQIRPDSSAENGDDGGGERVILPMSCASEGAVDVYIEPHLPLRSLAVIGFTPVAEALARMAAGLEYAVVRVVAEDELRDDHRHRHDHRIYYRYQHGVDGHGRGGDAEHLAILALPSDVETYPLAETLGAAEEDVASAAAEVTRLNEARAQQGSWNPLVRTQGERTEREPALRRLLDRGCH